MTLAARALLLLLLGVALGTNAVAADAPQPQRDENRDLDLIPQTVTPAANSETSVPATSNASNASNAKIYLENAFTQSWLRATAVPLPPPPPSPWEERMLLDVRDQWRLAPRLNLAYSGRLNVRAEDRLGFPNHENVINEFREGYASWEPTDGVFVDAGRINLRSGVALGLNPTDYFRTRTVVEPLSVDPVVLREDRLGTLMLRAQRLWVHGSLTAAYAPAVASNSAIANDSGLKSFDPGFDRTNSQDRFLLKGSVDVVEGFAPELLAYHENGSTRWGLNLTQGVGQRVVAYAEWSGGPRPGLVEEALRFGRATGTLPPNAPGALQQDPRQHFRSELAAGASYTTEQPKITFNLEFNYNQAGFSGTNWDDWFQAGRSATGASKLAGQLWYIRAYANDQQEQLSRSAAFLRADWVDAFVPKLELSGFIYSNLLDGSGRLQLSADYQLSDHWTVGALVLTDFGARRSEFGSLPQAGSVLLKLVRYL
ncbi:MAG: hypothetical protein JO133_06070 [Burkholderiaceae bacterium]|nr:hypothetical protein [Burkholderiaceae bacterium]